MFVRRAASPGNAAAQPPAPPDGANVVIGGPVSAVNDSTYTLGGPEGSPVTVTTTSETTYVNADGSSASADSVKAGTFIMAEGTLSNQGKTLTADRVTIGRPEGGRHSFQAGRPGRGEGGPVGERRVRIAAPVGAVNGSTYTMDGPEGPSLTITATSGTTYVNADGSSASADSVKVGTFIVAEGTPSDDGETITAERITIGKSDRPEGGVRIITGGER